MLSDLDQFTTCLAAINSDMIIGVIVEQVPPTAADWLGGEINKQHINSEGTDV